MSPAVVIAVAAGWAAAAGVVDLTAALAARRRRTPAPRRRGAALRTALLALGRRVGGPAPPRDLADRLDAAAAPLTVADAMALKAGGALAGLLATLPFAAAAPGRLGPAVPVAGLAGGFLALDLWLALRARRRAAAMTVELPDVLDLLRVVVQAGLPPSRALREVGRRHRGLLAGELRRAAARSEVGEARREVLRHLQRRAPLPGVTALAAVLEQAEHLGTPPAEAIGALAAEAREARARARAERAARAAPKIQLIVALLLVPSVMLLVAAALAPAVLDAV